MPARFIVLAVAGFGLFVTAALLGFSPGQSAYAGVIPTPTPTPTPTPSPTATATATPTATPTPTSTPTLTQTPSPTPSQAAPAAQLPGTGTQPPADADFPWLLVAIVALGALALGGAVLLRRRPD